MKRKKRFITVKPKPRKWWKIFTREYRRDKKAARAARDILEYFWESNSVNNKIYDLILQSYKYGDGGIKVKWDTNAYKYGSGGWWQLGWDPSLLNAIKKPCEGKQIIYKTKEKINDKKESNEKERR